MIGKPPETMLRSVVHAVTRSHVEVHDLCCPDCKGKEASFAVVAMAADSQLRMRH